MSYPAMYCVVCVRISMRKYVCATVKNARVICYISGKLQACALQVVWAFAMHAQIFECM